MVALDHDLDERNLRDLAGLEGGEVDVELVRVEADRHVELEAGGYGGARRRRMARRKGHEAGSFIAGEGCGGLLATVHRDPHRAADRLHDRPGIRRMRKPVGLYELERGRRTVARADALIGRRARRRRWP